MIATDKIGLQEATENVTIMNSLNYFFSLTKEAHKKMFVVELYKLFDTNDDAISLRRIIHSIRTHQEELRKEPSYRLVSADLLKKCRPALQTLDDKKLKPIDFRQCKLSHSISIFHYFVVSTNEAIGYPIQG